MISSSGNQLKMVEKAQTTFHSLISLNVELGVRPMEEGEQSQGRSLSSLLLLFLLLRALWPLLSLQLRSAPHPCCQQLLTCLLAWNPQLVQVALK
jgi:hypothetical protein